MKRIILISIIGLTTTMAINSADAQGTVLLDNYNSYGALITYGGGPNQIGGTVAGNGVVNGSTANGIAGNVTWTVGLYYALGNVTGSVASDPSGVADPSTLGGGLTSLTGNPGDTTTFGGVADLPGTFASIGSYAVIPGYTSGLVTFEVVAHSDSSYDGSNYRGHSSAFTLTPATGSTLPPPISAGNYLTGPGGLFGMQTFGVYAVPEPSVFALSGIGAAALILVRRKK